MDNNTLTEINLPNLQLVKKGKVRSIFKIDDNYLIVASDRVSAFDFILPNGIPHKGEVLTKISDFWFNKLDHIINSHFITADFSEFPSVCKEYENILRGRSMLVKQAEVLPVECIIRGYLSGSGWKSYQKDKSICGIPLSDGMQESEQLVAPIFTPTTKAEVGEHDENIDYEDVEKAVGKDIALKIKQSSLDLYVEAQKYAKTKGIIIADTKFEFGLINDEVILIDEVLTPDSSRFWPIDSYEVGCSQPSFDKQFVRDYLLGIKWDKKPPVPVLPDDIVQKTSEKYKDIQNRLLN